MFLEKSHFYREDVDAVLDRFLKGAGPRDRYTSFDYCYNYFKNTNSLTKDIEKSCLTLGFYLASWGMYRGSSFLRKTSSKHFQDTIIYIASVDKSVWDIDVDRYDEAALAKIEEIYLKVHESLAIDRRTHLTLVTKVLLGVFGFMPAFDSFFTKTFREMASGGCGFRSVNRTSLGIVRAFYEANRECVDKWSAQTFTTSFLTENKTTLNYPKAKIIDMYGFQKEIDERNPE